MPVMSGGCIRGACLEVRLLRGTLTQAFCFLGSRPGPIGDVEQAGSGKAVCSIWRAPQCETAKKLFIKKNFIHGGVV